jgi:glutamyl aminopeptidase
LVNRFTLNDRYLGRVPKSISSGFSTKLELEELKSFFAKYPEAGAGKLY